MRAEFGPRHARWSSPCFGPVVSLKLLSFCCTMHPFDLPEGSLWTINAVCRSWTSVVLIDRANMHGLHAWESDRVITPALPDVCGRGAGPRGHGHNTRIDPFICMAMQRAVHKAGSQPEKGVTGTVAPVDYKIFKTVHQMLVSHLPVPVAGQGISMNRYVGPVQKTGMNGGPVSFGFDLTVTEVVASVTMERSWAQRANAASSSQSHKIACGPVFHHQDGCIGCVAAPVCFTYKPSGKYMLGLPCTATLHTL